MQKDIKTKSGSWVYSDMVKDHFLHPRNFVAGEQPDWEWNGVGEMGSPACGDVMRIWIKVEDDRIVNFGWKTFGCASAIASTSMLSEMVLDDGLTVTAAAKITPKDIIERLGGLPENKIHCSVLGDQALRKAIQSIKN